jgi:hypothetical protein
MEMQEAVTTHNQTTSHACHQTQPTTVNTTKQNDNTVFSASVPPDFWEP